MSFMQLYTNYGDWYVIDTTCGTEIIDYDFIGELPTISEDSYEIDVPAAWDKIKDYVEVSKPEHVYSITEETGWCARYSAPGYMDCTPWMGPYETEEEAAEECAAIYGED